MLAGERLEKILEIIQKENTVKVNKLSDLFKVSKDLIRKDLSKLEAKGFVIKTYGGAMLKRKIAPNINIPERRNKNSEIKNKIALKAYELIQSNEVIFLDISTVNVYLAQKISEGTKKITVITNMLDILNVLLKSKHIKIICIGGVLNKNIDGFIGAETISYLQNYKFDKCFLGTTGIDVYNRTVTTFEAEDGETKKVVLNNSKHVYLAMENKKFYQDGNYIFSDLSKITGVITEEKPSKELVKELEELKIKIF